MKLFRCCDVISVVLVVCLVNTAMVYGKQKIIDDDDDFDDEEEKNPDNIVRTGKLVDDAE